jgi:hypothetical protein
VVHIQSVGTELCLTLGSGGVQISELDQTAMGFAKNNGEAETHPHDDTLDKKEHHVRVLQHLHALQHRP